jgi:hypothetical protein
VLDFLVKFFFLILRPSLLTFEFFSYECLHLVIKLEISKKNRTIDHDITKITLSTWFGSSCSSSDDSSMIVSCWCIDLRATCHISNADSSSDSEPDEGTLQQKPLIEALCYRHFLNLPLYNLQSHIFVTLWNVS